jgi:diadenosine tetraphosphatase ApaH/serine/threonine PP2A family protein phosphatase
LLVAILSDIHANQQALEACLRHARGIGAQGYAFLGDLVGYGADPGAVLDRVGELAQAGAPVVLGNHDVGVLGDEDSTDGEARRAAQWTQSVLTPAHRDFLKGLPLTHRAERVLYVHASALKPSDYPYIRGPEGARDSLKATDATHTFVGHMHHQRLYYLAADGLAYSFKPTPGVAIPVPSHRRWLAVVGSVGQPRDRDNTAAYVTFDAQKRQLTFHRVPYDWEQAAARIRQAGLPGFFADRLEDGV